MKIVGGIIFIFLVSMTNVPASSNGVLDRHAVFIGSNDGGRDRVSLRYAQSDALSIATVFEELGYLSRKNNSMLLDPAVAEVRSRIATIQENLSKSKNSGKRQELIFYYSGHSDEKGLLLKDGRYDYRELREQLERMDADIRVALLDSCESESFMKSKGGKRLEPLELDTANNVKGYAFLASSSENEAAQESRSINGSFFTHYFVSALRGAGDTSLDKKITLNEAYQFAYNETLARTQYTRAGAQHAAYDMQLSGAGDLVLTDLHQSATTLSLGDDVDGRVFIEDKQGRQIAELTKVHGQMLEVGLSPAEYTVVVRNQDIWRASADLLAATTAFVSTANLEKVSATESTLRGSPRYTPLARMSNDNRWLSLGYQVKPKEFVLTPNRSEAWVNNHQVNGRQLSVFSGVNLSYEYNRSPRTTLLWNAYLLADDAYLFGGSLQYNYQLLKHTFANQLKLTWRFGAGPFVDLMQGYINKAEAPGSQTSYVPFSSFLSFSVNTGLQLQYHQYGLELSSVLSPTYRDSEKYEDYPSPDFTLRLSYKLK